MRCAEALAPDMLSVPIILCQEYVELTSAYEVAAAEINSVREIFL